MGILKPGPEKTLVDRYLEWSRYKFSVREFDARKTKDCDRALLSACPAGSYKIALDEGGKQLDSQQFAEILRKHADVAFMIGAADGHGALVRESSDLSLSLGRMTMAHALARVVLAEQIYRAHTIITGHPYHR